MPISAGDDGHFTGGIGAGAVEDLVRVAMLWGIEIVGVGVRCAVVAVRLSSRHAKRGSL